MKKYAAVAAVVVLALIASSCETDVCAKTECGTYGNCTDIAGEAVCLCTNGYEENADGKCEIRSTNKFVGTWTAAETCADNILGTTIEVDYDVVVTESSSEITRIFLDGLSALDCGTVGGLAEPVATVAMDAFTVDVATYCKDNFPASLEFSGYQFVSGSGTFDDKGDTNVANDEVNMSYRVKFTQKNGSVTEEYDFTCTVKLTRK